MVNFSQKFCMNYKNAAVRKNDASEGIDTNKASLSEGCMTCHY